MTERNEEERMTDVLIAGAGIVGLVTALSAHALGLKVKLVEQAQELLPLGTGINLQPQAVRELIEMGLDDELDLIGVRTRELVYVSKRGHRIWSEPRGEWAGYRWPQYSLHRGKLQMMLLEVARRRLADGAIMMGWQVAGYEQRNGEVRLLLKDAAGNARIEKAPVLIACDGIHSAIRAQMYPDEGSPKWGGAVLWRATSEAPAFLSGATMAMIGHEWQKFVTYPISAPDPETGRAVINWVAELKYEPTRQWNREDYNRPGRLEEFLPSFESWVFDWLDIPRIIRTAPKVSEFPMVDRDPLPRWTDGRVTLAGDAAHPMYPIGSNGASQGVMDARVLCRCLRDHGLSPVALEAYEAERRPITTKIVLANRSNGPDQVMELVERRCGGEFANITDVLSTDELEQTAAGYKRLVGQDVESLNARASTL
jgi:2-polyprenyl-6-methoxyphenol hydroxylase-like FAD-dependent oxidoreductase